MTGIRMTRHQLNATACTTQGPEVREKVGAEIALALPGSWNWPYCSRGQLRRNSHWARGYRPTAANAFLKHQHRTSKRIAGFRVPVPSPRSTGACREAADEDRVQPVGCSSSRGRPL